MHLTFEMEIDTCIWHFRCDPTSALNVGDGSWHTNWTFYTESGTQTGRFIWQQTHS